MRLDTRIMRFRWFLELQSEPWRECERGGGKDGPATRLLMVIAGLLDTDNLVRKTGRLMI